MTNISYATLPFCLCQSLSPESYWAQNWRGTALQQFCFVLGATLGTTGIFFKKPSTSECCRHIWRLRFYPKFSRSYENHMVICLFKDVFFAMSCTFCHDICELEPDPYHTSLCLLAFLYPVIQHHVKLGGGWINLSLIWTCDVIVPCKFARITALHIFRLG